MTPDRRRLLGRLGAAIAAPWLAGRALAAPAQIGQAVDWPTVTLLDGRRLGPADWRAQAALVVFFSTTCPFCARHNEHLAKLIATLAKEQPGLPLRVLGVAQDRDADAVRRYLAAKQLPIDVTQDDGPMHAALSMRRVIPLTCAVDRAGRLREVIPGEMFEEDVLALGRWARA